MLVEEVKVKEEKRSGFQTLDPSTKKAIYSGIALILLVIVFSIARPTFLTPGNLINIAQQVVTYAILGFGLTFCLVCGGTDLSAGASMALSGIIVTTLLISGVPLWISIIVSMVFGILMGVLNGFTIEVLGVVPFIATLGTQWVFRGLANVLVEGKPIYTNVIPDTGIQEAFYAIGGGRLPGGLPYSVIIVAVYGLILAFLLAKTRIGRQIYACGSNLEAAKLSGINAVGTRMFAYCVSEFSAAIAGIIVTSRISSAQPMAGNGLEMEAIAAAVIGGVSNSGGQGAIINTVIGALIMGVLRNGLNLLGVSSFWQQVIIGIIIVAVIALDVKRNKKGKK
ncbi:ABC transporter permease [Jeotgalibaca caeni]|uniref:ABC transporter permease n=1 Tax=Jeotgalibaca caeni TaxID=3028623 RepID=UPI00237D7513|nr:ABC transporter permease [Jeotgalibaca caeni]MDE1548631.1 ABC transporter permease [Jeotgalibaca caeni]